MSEMIGAVPPNSLEAERAVLGGVLQDPETVSRAVEELQPEDFYQAAHREIFKCVQRLFRQQKAVDLVTVSDELEAAGTLDGIGGKPYLLELISYVPTTVNMPAYIRIVLEKSTLRSLISAAGAISRDCYAQDKPLQDVMNKAEKAIFDIVMRRTGSEALIAARDIVLSTYEQIEQLDKLKGGISGVPTGFTALDQLLTGLHPGEFILIGARPSMGKTSFAMNIAANAAIGAGKTVAVFSLEMPREQIIMRMLCSTARVDMQRVRQGKLRPDDWAKLARSLTTVGESKIYVDDTAGLSPTQLRSRCRRLMMEQGLDLVIVDYLGLMHADGEHENRQLEVSAISRQLKAIALELKIPLIACAQLSRAATTRTDKRPVLSDLRDSGSIEQDADVVMFLHRQAYYDRDSTEKNVAEVIVAKQRNGPLDNIKLAWLSEYTTFTNLLGGEGGAPSEAENPY